MDPRSIAHLDKTRRKVMCGSCHRQIAHIDDTLFSEYEGLRCTVHRPNSKKRVVFKEEVSIPIINRETKTRTIIRGYEFEVSIDDGLGSVHGVWRTLVVDWGCRPQLDGIWKLTTRAAKRLEQGKLPAVRRQKGVVHFWDGPAGEYQEQSRSREPGVELTLPARLQCYWCSSVQVLDAGALQLTIRDQFFIGSDMVDWRKKFGDGRISPYDYTVLEPRRVVKGEELFCMGVSTTDVDK